MKCLAPRGPFRSGPRRAVHKALCCGVCLVDGVLSPTTHAARRSVLPNPCVRHACVLCASRGPLALAAAARAVQGTAAWHAATGKQRRWDPAVGCWCRQRLPDEAVSVRPLPPPELEDGATAGWGQPATSMMLGLAGPRSVLRCHAISCDCDKIMRAC